MNKLTLSLATLCLMALTGCHTARQAVVQQPAKSLVVLYDNDVHCAIDGYARMAGLRDAIRDTADVAIVSSGDYIQGGTAGAISHGQYIADIMQHMHYDAITLGNHEFDYYVPRLFELEKTIGAPVVCCNFFDMQHNLQYAPYVIRTIGTKRVAFVGVVTPSTRYTEEYSFLDKEGNQLYDLAEKDVYRLVQESVDAAHKEGVDYVVVLSHLGEAKNVYNVDSHGLIAATNGIDVVLDGHTHSVIPTETVLNKDGKSVLISQTGTKFANVGKLVIHANGQKSTQLIPIESIKRENAEVKYTTDSINAIAANLVNRPVCISDVDLRILDENGRQAVRMGETNAGDIVTDAYRIMTGADLAITNGGGIRTETKSGNLTYGDIVALLPYDNYVCIVDITGQQLKDILTACTRTLPDESGDFPQVSGIKFTANSPAVVEKNGVEPITDLCILNKQTGKYEPVILEHIYNLATIDYCITGGGLAGMLKKNSITKPSIVIYNECLIQYITEVLHGHIGKEYAEPQGRITVNK